MQSAVKNFIGLLTKVREISFTISWLFDGAGHNDYSNKVAIDKWWGLSSLASINASHQLLIDGRIAVSGFYSVWCGNVVEMNWCN